MFNQSRSSTSTTRLGKVGKPDRPSRSKIDLFFIRLYKPIEALSLLLWDYLESLKSGSILYQIFYKLGRKIPAKCPFKARYNLAWTPCFINPFFSFLVVLKLWSADEEDFITIGKYSSLMNQARDPETLDKNNFLTKTEDGN